ncbi:helix-turn-helix transcriptional regulator [Anaerosporobacter faecicola]|uniref:helix-turn-helix transcriptional regulator n=1 Tax=Anaerosporobacter faecicola TaxID=2718714 RepID=UPI00143B3996|nr:AraC family transcriptional regulator [Anaerosporobacter faecicola]
MYKVNYCGYNMSNVDYDKIERPNGSGDYLFLHFMTPMKVKLANSVEITKKNACILYSVGHKQEYQAIKKFTNSFFHFSTTEAFIDTYHIPVNQIFYPSNYLLINELIRQLYVEYLGKEMLYEQHIHATIEHILIALSRELYNKKESTVFDQDLYAKFHEARIQILSNIDTPWSTESMAELTHLGKSQFYHYYQLFFRRSPKAELLEARIEHAKYLLSNEALSIAQITTLCGFDNVSHFTRYFKRNCNLTPSMYRNSINK